MPKIRLTYDLAVYDLDNLSGGTTPDEETTYSILLDTTTDGFYGDFFNLSECDSQVEVTPSRSEAVKTKPVIQAPIH